MRGLSAYEMLCARGLVSGCSVNGLGGLGAAPKFDFKDPKNSFLADPKTGQFSNVLFENAKKALYAARDAAWAALNGAKSELAKFAERGGDQGPRARAAIASLDKNEFADFAVFNSWLDAAVNDVNHFMWSRKPGTGRDGTLISSETTKLSRLPAPYDPAKKGFGYPPFEAIFLNYALLALKADEAVFEVSQQRPGWFASVSGFLQNVREWPKAWAGGVGSLVTKYKKGELLSYATSGDLVKDLLDGSMPDAAAVELAERMKNWKNELNALDKKLADLEKTGVTEPKKLQDIRAAYTASFNKYQGYLYMTWAVPVFAVEYKRQGVRPPITAVAIASSDIAKKVHDKLKEQGQSTNLSGLGIEPLTVATIAIVGIIAAYIANVVADAQTEKVRTQGQSEEAARLEREQVREDVKAGKLPPEALEQTVKAQEDQAKAREEANKGPLDFMQYLPWIIGGVAVIAVLPTITSLARGASAASATAGLGRAPRRRQRLLRF